MKISETRVRSFVFGILVVLATYPLSGCDGGIGTTGEEADAGTDAGRTDVQIVLDTGKNDLVRPVACSIPATTAPANSASVSYVTTTTDVEALCETHSVYDGTLKYQGLLCGHPEMDWGASGAAFCLYFSSNVDGSVVVGDLLGGKIARQVAVCSAGGNFLGWGCR